MGRRELVCRSEDAGHPFRRTLAPVVLTAVSQEEAEPAKWWKQEDTHLFLMSFIAFFIVFYSFIA